MDDISKDIRIRASARVHEIFIEELGFTPMMMNSITDVYDALNRGALEGIVLNPADWAAYGFDELFGYTLSGVSIGTLIGYVAMTEETWDSFTPEVQKTFEEKASELIYPAAELVSEETKKSIASNSEHGGELIDFNRLDPEVQEHINKTIINTWNNWIETLESQGHAFGSWWKIATRNIGFKITM